MITDIRKQLQSPAARGMAIFMLLGVAGIFTLPSLLKQGFGSKPWVVQVDGSTIYYDEFRTELAEKKEQLAGLRQQYGQYADVLLASMGIDSNPQSLAANSLIRGALVSLAAKNAGIQLHYDFIASQIRAKSQDVLSLIPPYAIDQFGNIDQNVLKQYLARRGMTIEEFEIRLEQMIMRKMVGELVAASVHVPAFEVERQLMVMHAPKTFSVFHFSRDSFLKKEKEIALTQEELQDFYARQNQQYKRYWVPEQRSAMVWEFDPKDYGLTVSEKQIARYYDDYKARDFVDQPTRIQVRSQVFPFEDEIDMQQAFEKAKQAYADAQENPGSFSGELIPFFARGTHDPAFEKAAFLLKDDGDISQVVQTEKGFEIVQRVARKKQTYKSLNAVKNDIKQILLNKEFVHLFAKDLKQLTRKAKSSRKALDTFITEKSGKAQTITNAVKDENDIQLKTIFALKKDALGSYVRDGKGYVVRVTAIEKPHVSPFEQVEKTVANDLYEQRANQAMKQALQEAEQLVKESTSLVDLKKQIKASFESVMVKDPADGDEIQSLQEKGLPAYRMLALERAGAAMVGHTAEGGYVVRLEAIKSFDKEKLEEKVSEVRADLENKKNQLAFEGFIASSYRNAKINMNESLLGIA